MEEVAEYTLVVQKSMYNASKDFDDIFESRRNEILDVSNVFENGIALDSTSYSCGMSTSSKVIKSENISDTEETTESSCIKAEWKEETIENVDTNITLDYKDGAVHCSIIQSYGMVNSSVNIESENVSNIEGTEESTCGMNVKTEDADIESIFNRDERNIECRTYNLKQEIECKIEDAGNSFRTEEFRDLCDNFLPVVHRSSELTNEKDLDFVTTYLPPWKRKNINTKFENITDFDEKRGTPHVMRIKTHYEEENLHVTPDNTDAKFILSTDGANSECVTHSSEYVMMCKVEETQILFGTGSVPAVQRSPEFTTGNDHDFATTSSLQLNKIERSERNRSNRLDGIETFSPKKGLSQGKNTSKNIQQYVCPNCNKRFKLKRYLTRHQMTQHTDHKPHKCPDCDVSYAVKYMLDRHQTSRHSKPKVHKCPDCEKSFAGKFNLNKHRTYKHSKPKPREFPDCDTKSTVNIHECPDCERSFKRKCSLDEHQMLKHSKPKPHECPDCGQSFVTKYMLELHQMSRHSKPKPHKCPDCDMSFAKKSILNQHQMSRHSKLKCHKCPDCEKSFIRNSSLSQHQMLKHSKPKPYQCPDCDQSFITNYTLGRHQMYQHSKRKPHKCPDCEMSFVAKQNLNRHQMARHSTPKPHGCPDCEKSFITMYYLRQHQMSRHSKPKPHECPDCGNSFATGQILNRHQMSRHSKPKPYECVDCRKTFVTKHTLRRHQVSRHSTR